ncbi:MAG: tryptophan 2,3-dioxygenase [Nevskia sp.]|nr:tryptophan 2,3-dioxygenase [Nevskia sp.]
MSDPKAVTYASYLQLDQLLNLQQPQSEEHDELLFIVIHQVYELWFKQELHELYAVRTALLDDDAPRALAALKRVLTILKTLVAQIDVLETMTPLSFSAFRQRLQASSGFQSHQFRAIELLLGHKRDAVLGSYLAGSNEHTLLSRLLSEPSIYDAFLRWLALRGVAIPAAALSRDPVQATVADPLVQDALLQVYRERPLEAQLCERLVDLDEGLQEWRYRHVKMVERTIGFKAGTGGSAGAAYLRETLFRPLFPDLWAIRARL